MRVVVPDLEEIARLYLRALELARQGDRGWQDNYDWMMVELYDQTIREVSGGGHGAYLNRPVIPNRAFVLMRHGREAAESIAGQERARAQPPRCRRAKSDDRPAQPRRFTRTRLLGVLRRLRRTFSPRRSSARREARIQRLLGDEYELLQLGRFRRGGEVHQWMYRLLFAFEGSGPGRFRFTTAHGRQPESRERLGRTSVWTPSPTARCTSRIRFTSRRSRVQAT